MNHRSKREVAPLPQTSSGSADAPGCIYNTILVEWSYATNQLVWLCTCRSWQMLLLVVLRAVICCQEAYIV
ncbi:hypothetical protein PAHAL_3G203800 [Panicum hallii]|uniref:Uncharacterized protein n=1 Tax=Panicum hallii TaxID=206008 RepID=A0A2S3HAA0_9POAL|nr:hypothetical protein PAHAL_3G203800 [Panicum hallii]